jgi:hypothetical protein
MWCDDRTNLPNREVTILMRIGRVWLRENCTGNKHKSERRIWQLFGNIDSQTEDNWICSVCLGGTKSCNRSLTSAANPGHITSPQIQLDWHCFSFPFSVWCILHRQPNSDPSRQPPPCNLLKKNYAQPIRWRCIQWPDIKSHKIPSVAFKSRCTMIILDKLFIYQLESNLLYSILHISEAKPTGNDTCAPWSSVVSLFETSKCDSQKCHDYVLGYNDTLGTF